MEPRFGEQYKLFIEGRPVPKSTMTPPVIRKAMSPAQKASAVKSIISRDPKYAPLKQTQEYQYYVAKTVWAGPDDEFPHFSKQDPIKLTFSFHKEKHERGDLKNLIAGIEDGIQHSGYIPDDGQVTTHGESSIFYFAENPGVWVTAEIDPLAGDRDWLEGWLNTSKKKMEAYITDRDIQFRE